jgi:hypothetical protein
MVDVALKLYYHPQPSKPEWRFAAKPVALPSRVWIRLLEVGLSQRSSSARLTEPGRWRTHLLSSGGCGGRFLQAGENDPGTAEYHGVFASDLVLESAADSASWAFRFVAGATGD